jgi:transposase
MTRAEAGAIYDRGRAATIAALLGLARRLAALEARLAQTSRTSSRPPSTDPPGTPRPRRPPSGRRPGGQPGHPGRSRPLVPVDGSATLKVTSFQRPEPDQRERGRDHL